MQRRSWKHYLHEMMRKDAGLRKRRWDGQSDNIFDQPGKQSDSNVLMIAMSAGLVSPLTVSFRLV